jgi:Uma2 family endonuclease
MSERIITKSAPNRLVEGQRLDQPTFHALYETMPAGTRAELIDGVVYLPDPVGSEHAFAHIPVIIWLDYYAERTTGVRVADNATTILGWKSEPQPDALLRIEPECGGQSHDGRGYVAGPPEFVVEVSKASRYVDLGPKLDEYERAGVREYLVRAIDPDEIYWFARDQRNLVQQSIGDDGLYRSTVFPGLWLDPAALLAGNRNRLRAVIDRGCATPEHAAFVAQLAAARISASRG